MTQPGNEPVNRNGWHSTYTQTATNLNEVKEFIAGLYAVGAIGDEQVIAERGKIWVNVASEDLLPPLGHDPITVRHKDWQQMHNVMFAQRLGILGLLVVIVAGLWWVL